MRLLIKALYSSLLARARGDSSRFLQSIAFVAERAVNKFQRKKCLNEAPSSELVKLALRNLEENGFFVIQNYASSEMCADLRAKLDIAIIKNPEVVHPGTPYDLRIHGIENVDKSFRFFNEDAMLKEIACLYLREPARPAFTLAARLEAAPNNPGSGGGWHRDSNFRQFKTLLYLDNVSEKNGPFRMLTKSHQLLKMIKDNAIAKQKYSEVRLADKWVKRILELTSKDRLKVFTADVGTLVMFDSSTIHGGAPVVEGFRYAITNYYYAERSINTSVYRHFQPVAGFDQIKLELG